MTEDKFLEKAARFHIMEDVEGGKFYTLEEYRAAAESIQKNKMLGLATSRDVILWFCPQPQVSWPGLGRPRLLGLR